MDLLILGGTGFIGPHQIRYALARGHRITLFNRGTVPIDGVEQLHGDREGDLDSLRGRTWDAVIDNPARQPRWVRDAAQLLKDSAEQYLFVSTVSVYEPVATPGLDESAPLLSDDTYGGLKARAEAEARWAFGERTTITRPGLLVGPGDPTDRFTYWPWRIAKGGEVLAPGEPSDPVQFIDIRDFAEFTIRLVEQRAFGTFNVTGEIMTIAEMLDGIRAIAKTDAQFTWVPAGFLAEQKVSAWSDLPVWIPPVGEAASFARRNIRRALAQGLTFRSFAATVQATLEEARRKTTLKAGLTLEREADVLAAWKRESQR